MNGIHQLKHNPYYQQQTNQPMRAFGYPNMGIQIKNAPQYQIGVIPPKQMVQMIPFPNNIAKQVQIQQYVGVQPVIPQINIVSPRPQLQQQYFNQPRPQQIQQPQLNLQQNVQPSEQRRSHSVYTPQQQQYQVKQQVISQEQSSYQPSRKTSQYSEFQPILPYAFLDNSNNISNIQSCQQSPWSQHAKQDHSFILPLDKIQYATTVTGGNTEITSRQAIQEIRPIDLYNYNGISYQNLPIQKIEQPKEEIQQNFHTFYSPEQQNSNIINQEVLNVSFSQDKRVGLEYEEKQHFNKKSQQNSPNASLVLQQNSMLLNAPQVTSPGYSVNNSPSTVRNSPAIKIDHHQPTLTFLQNFNDQLAAFRGNQRSKSTLSPPKSKRESQNDLNSQQFISPAKPSKFKIALEQVQSYNPSPTSLSVRVQNLQNIQPEILETPIMGHVKLQYVSKNNPNPHFNDQPSQFHKTPERSRDAVSCVFFNKGQKKYPTRIKLKYTPIEQILTPEQLHEYQEKHQDLNLLQNDHLYKTENTERNQLSPFPHQSKIDNNQESTNFQNMKYNGSFASTGIVNDNLNNTTHIHKNESPNQSTFVKYISEFE